MSKLLVENIVNSHFDENCIYLHRENCFDGILIDPGIGESTISSYLDNKKYNVVAILITHAHIDHIFSCDYFRDKYNCDIYVSNIDNAAMIDPEKNASNIFYKPVSIDNCKTFNDGDILTFLDIDLKCIITPGHTMGSTCFYIEKDKILLSGDTLFAGAYGRTDLYGGSDIDMRNSLINKLFVLDKETKVYPGHGPDTIIGDESRANMIFYS